MNNLYRFFAFLCMLAWMMPARAQEDYSGTYFIGVYGKNSTSQYSTTSPNTNYYLCPTEDWLYYVATNSCQHTPDNGQPFLTSFQCKNGSYDDPTKAIWVITKHPTLDYYYIQQRSTGKYLVFNGKIEVGGTGGSNRIRVHLETITNDPGDKALFAISRVTTTDDRNGYWLFHPKNASNGYYLNITDGNHDSLQGTEGKIDGPTVTGYPESNNVGGTLGQWNETNNTSSFYLEDFPIITFNPGNLIEITALQFGADLIYTTDGTTPSTTNPNATTISGTTGNTTTTSFTPADDVTTIKAVAVANGKLSDVATITIPQGNAYSRDYLKFNVLTDGIIPWKSFGSVAKEISYKINDGSWISITAGSDAVIEVNAGDVVRFKGSNSVYATDKNNYSGFDGGTATYDISGNIMSLVYGDNFVGQTTLSGTYNFCSLFKQSKAVSAEHLILPATSLTACCYRAMFSKCHALEVAPALPATTLAANCYWYLFEECPITAAPELPAPTLVSNCYGYMFIGCTHLNYIKCLATTGFGSSSCLENWVKNVSSTGIFVKDENATWSYGDSGIPSQWTIYNGFLLYSPEISCDIEHNIITITCATQGASIYYRLNQTGDFLPYSSPISISETTTVEAYSSKEPNTSNTVTVTFEVFDNPFDESNRSLDSWTYGGTQVTLPYSVNGIDGHSANYTKGTHTFETTIALYTLHPTYLWFQHADQSADIYVDDTYVTTHWGGYNAFFVDISDYVHQGTNRIKVILNNTTRNVLAPCAGDFNFNATLGKVKLFTSPVLPSMDYGYDGFHITATDVSSSAATLTIKTKVPLGATLICKIDDEDSNYHYSTTESSTGEDQTFTTTIDNPILWNGTINPHLYTVTLEIYKDGDLYHRFQRDYGIRFFEYVINEPIGNEFYTGFLLNGSPYLLRGVCMHDDLEGKANALNDDDYAQEFAIIQELGCNFIRLAHYPHPKEVYDWCDRLGIIVQTEVPCVNKLQSTMPQDYYDHLYIQYEDMVRQHFNHPCIVFWGLSNETTTDDKEFGNRIIEAYTSFIKGLDSERLVGYVMSHSYNDPSGYYNNPDVDWFGCNIYVGWYIDQNSNNPTTQLNTRLNNTLTSRGKPLAFSEYGGGGTPSCHSDDFMNTTTRGNNPRHDIEYQMWLHEGHIAAIKNKPELLFTSQWQLFDIAVSSRNEGYTVCLDGENTSIDDDLRYLNNKGLVERDHKTRKDTYYLYKAWWNPTDKFVHICGKDYEKLTNRVIKCYTNDTTNNCTVLSLYVNGVFIETAQVDNNKATFTARSFNPGDVIRVDGATTNEAFTIPNIFINDGDWDVAANWKANAISADGSDAIIRAECTIPNEAVARANNITLDENGSLTVADGGQLYHNNEGVIAAVEKNITAYTVSQNQGESLSNGWYFIASPITDGYTPTGSMVENTYDLYRLNNTTWENYKNTTSHPDFTTLNNGTGYLYANEQDVTLAFTGALKPYSTENDAHLMDIAPGYNLIGNPYTFAAYINQPYYSLNNEQNIVLPSEIKNEAINPCTGVIVDGGENGVTVGFYKESQSIQAVNNGNIQMTLTQTIATRGNSNVETLDKAIVSFNQGDQLGKFYFGKQNANIYIPQSAKEYAVVSVGRDAMHCVSTEIPVNFKAKENGTYTIAVNSEGVEMSYLHLIDNMTDADVDLLQTPEYAFNAKTTDYESRFKLVFACGDTNDDNETFAFINNGNIIITADVEGATLQVIDVMGRVIVSREGDISGNVSTSGMTPGTYVLRLINVDNVKTQKIVIR